MLSLFISNVSSGSISASNVHSAAKNCISWGKLQHVIVTDSTIRTQVNYDSVVFMYFGRPNSFQQGIAD